VRVSICVSTYKRPEGLLRLLEGLNRLTFSALEAPIIEVVVVDNEAQGAALAACLRAKPTFRWTLHCHEEPRRGITYARNRCLDAITPPVDFIAFIDDDEVPEPLWLESLLLAQSRYGADVVTGPVSPDFESPSVPTWILRGAYFGPRRHPDGYGLDVAFTNNVLMRGRIPAEMDRQFDHRFALTGGEDTEFFMQVRKAGYRIVWAEGAIVRETIPPSRTTISWILRRGYREWGSHSRCESAIYPSLGVRVQRVAKATALICAGCASLPLTALMGRHRLVRSLLLVSRGLGSYAGLLGKHYAEYSGASPS